MRRVAASYWVQTPNYWFPIEPHFNCVGWQWLPPRVRAEILRRKDCGWRYRKSNLQEALTAVQEVRLLSRHEMRELFPDAVVVGEKLGPLTKSWIAYGGLIKESSSAGSNVS